MSNLSRPFDPSLHEYKLRYHGAVSLVFGTSLAEAVLEHLEQRSRAGLPMPSEVEARPRKSRAWQRFSVATRIVTVVELTEVVK